MMSSERPCSDRVAAGGTGEELPLATYAIGDIQGCYDTLTRLLGRIRFTPGVDRILLVGDLVNRGPKSLDVLRWAKTHAGSVETVLGNHDLHLIGRLLGTSGPKRRDTLEDVLAAPDRHELLDWLRQRPLLHREGHYTVVHAGFLPTWSTRDAERLAQEAEAALRSDRAREVLRATRERGPFRWNDALKGLDRLVAIFHGFTLTRTCFADGTPNLEYNASPREAPPGSRPWFEFPSEQRRDTTVIFGHWAALGLHLGGYELGLDTGAIWGNQLTAIRLDDRAIFHEPAVERRHGG
jgi:bis(5'-nucleosyl)-tetraphosphatase (symmetrical)